MIEPALVLSLRCEGPWLAIRHGSLAVSESIVLVGDPRAPGMWRRVNAAAPAEVGRIENTQLTPLSDFGVSVTLYSHSRVLSVWRSGLSRAKRYHTREHWDWEGARIERLRVERSPAIVDLLRDAARDCNTLGVVRP